MVVFFDGRVPNNHDAGTRRPGQSHMTSHLLALLLAAGAADTGGAKAHEVLAETTTMVEPGISKTVLTVQVVTVGPGGQEVRDPLNRFNITRVRPAKGKVVGPVLLRSPFNYDVRFYEVEAGGHGYHNTLLGNLAQRRFDVWVVDDRINTAQPGACESGQLDCSIMSTWTVENKVGDTEFARSLVVQAHPGVKPILGGFVGGAIEAMAALNANPNGYGGFFGWQGTLHADDPSVREYNAPFCQIMGQLQASGMVYDGSPALLKDLLQRAREAPNEPGPQIPAQVLPLPEGLTNRQTLLHIMTQNLPSPSFPTPWWNTAAGTWQPPELFHLDEHQFFSLAAVANNYAAMATMRDYSCGLAGERTFHDNLAAFTGDVLLFGTERAFGPLMEDTKGLFTQAHSVEVNVIADFGELDRIFHPRRKKLADAPFASWAKSVLRAQAR
jgi:hypothetical protein